MATASIPLIAVAVEAIAPEIPTIVQFVENLFGHSSTTGKQNGPQKMAAAVTLLQQSLDALANAGVLKSAPVVEPTLPAGLAGAVQQSVNSMKSQGLLGPPQAAAAPAPKVTPAPAVQPPNITTPPVAKPITLVGTFVLQEQSNVA